MRESFRWNPYADQPHNVATRSERFLHHFRYLGSYFSLVVANIKKVFPGWPLYRRYRKSMHTEPIALGHPFALSLSPVEGRNEEVVQAFLETGIRRSLVRIPSWEQDQLAKYEVFINLLASKYRFIAAQPVDMFPHTDHVENVVLLEKLQDGSG